MPTCGGVYGTACPRRRMAAALSVVRTITRTWPVEVHRSGSRTPPAQQHLLRSEEAIQRRGKSRIHRHLHDGLDDFHSGAAHVQRRVESTDDDRSQFSRRAGSGRHASSYYDIERVLSRPPTVFREELMIEIGIDFGGTKVEVAALGTGGQLLARRWAFQRARVVRAAAAPTHERSKPCDRAGALGAVPLLTSPAARL